MFIEQDPKTYNFNLVQVMTPYEGRYPETVFGGCLVNGTPAVFYATITRDGRIETASVDPAEKMPYDYEAMTYTDSEGREIDSTQFGDATIALEVWIAEKIACIEEAIQEAAEAAIREQFPVAV